MSSMPMLSGGSGKAAMLTAKSPAPHSVPITLSALPKAETRQKRMAKSVMLAAMRQSQAMSSPKCTASLNAMSAARDGSASGISACAAKSACCTESMASTVMPADAPRKPATRTPTCGVPCSKARTSPKDAMDTSGPKAKARMSDAVPGSGMKAAPK